LEAFEGGTIFRSSVEDLGSAARGLLWLDCEITIRKPDELREELRRLAVRATALAEREEETNRNDARRAGSDQAAAVRG
jgi:hypothetical protein